MWEYPFPFSGGRPGWTSGMAQAVGAQALARTAELVPDDAAALRRSATAAYRAIPRHLLTSVAGGPVDQALLVRLARRPERTAAGGRVAAVLRRGRGGRRRRCPRGADAPRRCGDARALRLRLLELLRAAGRLVAARLPAVRRRAAEAPRAVRRALRLGGDAVCRVRQAAAGVQGHDGQPRLAALLALEAGDRHCDDRRGCDQAPLALRRLALARLAGAEARRLLRGARRRRRLGGQPRRLRHVADRARRRDGSPAEGRASHCGRTRCRPAAARRRCGHHRSRSGPGCGRRGAAARSLRRLVAGRSGRARSRARRRAAAGSGTARDRRRPLRGARGRRSTGSARAVRRVARPAGAVDPRRSARHPHRRSRRRRPTPRRSPRSGMPSSRPASRPRSAL